MGLSEFEIISSLSSVNNKKQIFKSNQRSGLGQSSNQGGQSNSFFFVTEDNNFIVKTITANEKKVLLNLLGCMEDQLQVQTFLSLPLGLFQVQLQGFETIYLIVMLNLERNVEGRRYKFDLKGSTYSRQVLHDHEEYNFKATLKDLDLIRMVYKTPSLLSLDQEHRTQIL